MTQSYNAKGLLLHNEWKWHFESTSKPHHDGFPRFEISWYLQSPFLGTLSVSNCYCPMNIRIEGDKTTVLFGIMQPGYNRKPCLKLRKKQQWNNLFPFFIVSHLFCNFIGVRKGWNWGEGWWWEHVGMTFVNGNTRCNALIDQLR